MLASLGSHESVCQWGQVGIKCLQIHNNLSAVTGADTDTDMLQPLQRNTVINTRPVYYTLHHNAILITHSFIC